MRELAVAAGRTSGRTGEPCQHAHSPPGPAQEKPGRFPVRGGSCGLMSSRPQFSGGSRDRGTAPHRCPPSAEIVPSLPPISPEPRMPTRMMLRRGVPIRSLRLADIAGLHGSICSRAGGCSRGNDRGGVFQHHCCTAGPGPTGAGAAQTCAARAGPTGVHSRHAGAGTRYLRRPVSWAQLLRDPAVSSCRASGRC